MGQLGQRGPGGRFPLRVVRGPGQVQWAAHPSVPSVMTDSPRLGSTSTISFINKKTPKHTYTLPQGK